MKIGLAVSTFPTAFGPILFSGDLVHKLPMIAGLGYQSIDLFIRRADESGLGEVEHAIRATGLKVAIVAAVSAFVDEGLFLSSPDSAVRRALLERMKLQIEFAARLGARVPIGVLRGKEGGEERLKLLADSLFALQRIAEPMGVQFALEPVNRYETGLIHTVQEALDFLRRFGLPQFGLLPDTFHMNIEEASIETSIQLAGAQLAHIHLADSNRRVPGKGHLTWQTIFEALKKIDYQGACGLECIPGPYPTQDAREGINFLQQFA
jgi:5-keto-L-gluconate epimerase